MLAGGAYNRAGGIATDRPAGATGSSQPFQAAVAAVAQASVTLRRGAARYKGETERNGTVGMDQMARARSGLRVVVAEDEALAAMIIQDALGDEGHDVHLARDGQEALEIVGEAGLDLLVTDLAMPRMTGWELVPRLRARWPGLPVVVMTGLLPAGGIADLRFGSDAPLALLLKPFDLDALLEAVRLVMAEAAEGSIPS